jgi:hypothetical protein
MRLWDTDPEPLWGGDDRFWARSDQFASRQPTSPVLVDDDAYVFFQQGVRATLAGSARATALERVPNLCP